MANTSTGKASFSELNTSENETDPRGVEKTAAELDPISKEGSETEAKVTKEKPFEENTTLEEGTNTKKPSELIQESYQSEGSEEELLEETEKTTEREELNESQFEVAEGVEQTSPTKTPETDYENYDRTVVRNEKEEEPLSRKDILTKKTSIQAPIAIRETVVEIDFETNPTELGEEKSGAASGSRARVEAATSQQKPEGTKSVEKEKLEAEWSKPFGKQESIGDLYRKVLDAIAGYRQEKADRAYYQAYRAWTVESPEEAAEAEYQSLSATLEAEEKLDKLMNRAGKSASERARILKRIRVEASEMQEMLEEAKWKFCELTQEGRSTHEAVTTQSHVSKTNKGRTRMESRSSCQEEECSEAGSEKRAFRKEKEEVYSREQQEHSTKQGKNIWGKAERAHVLEESESLNEELTATRNKITGGAVPSREQFNLERSTSSRNDESIESGRGPSAGKRGSKKQELWRDRNREGRSNSIRGRRPTIKSGTEREERMKIAREWNIKTYQYSGGRAPIFGRKWKLDKALGNQTPKSICGRKR